MEELRRSPRYEDEVEESGISHVSYSPLQLGKKSRELT